LGREKGWRMSEVQKKLLSDAANRFYENMTEEQRKTFKEYHKKNGEHQKGKTRSEKTRKLMSKRRTGTHPTKETCKKMSEHSHFKGKPSWNKGLQMSEEIRKNMSISQTGKKLSTETKRKIGLFQIGNKRALGHKHDELTRKKMSDKLAGRAFSEDSKKKQSNAAKQRFDHMTEEERESWRQKVLSNRHRVSFPQRKLYLFLKETFADATLEYYIKTAISYRFADVGIPSLKLDFEYDGFFELGKHNKESDQKRDLELSDIGWKTIRINKDSLKLILSENNIALK
jgi:very-short-patch-repair endonuclease